jgi:PPOX class probable F420-dependent enzyme
MPRVPVPHSVEQFLREPHFAVVATLQPDGAPHTAMTWYDLEDGRILLNMDHSRLRLRFLRNDPRVAITVVDREDPYRHISLLGEVEDIHDDEGLADIDRLALRYTGAPYETRDSHRVSAWVRIDRWHGWDASRARVTHAGWGADAGG